METKVINGYLLKTCKLPWESIVGSRLHHWDILYDIISSRMDWFISEHEELTTSVEKIIVAEMENIKIKNPPVRPTNFFTRHLGCSGPTYEIPSIDTIHQDILWMIENPDNVGCIYNGIGRKDMNGFFIVKAILYDAKIYELIDLEE